MSAYQPYGQDSRRALSQFAGKLMPERRFSGGSWRVYRALFLKYASSFS